MSDLMYFPDTVDEFMELYKMTDTKEVYSNGTEYVPIFRMKQWFEHEEAKRTAKVEQIPDEEGTVWDVCECGMDIYRAWTYCPSCGARLEWE